MIGDYNTTLHISGSKYSNPIEESRTKRILRKAHGKVFSRADPDAGPSNGAASGRSGNEAGAGRWTCVGPVGFPDLVFVEQMPRHLVV